MARCAFDKVGDEATLWQAIRTCTVIAASKYKTQNEFVTVPYVPYEAQATCTEIAE